MSIRSTILILLGFGLALTWARPVPAAAAAVPTAGLFDATGGRLASYPDVSAGSSLATGDLDQDGIPELVVGSPPGVRAAVSIYALDGTLVRTIFPFSSSVKSGVNVAVGDTAGNGTAQIVVSTRRGVGPQVLIYRGDGRRLSPGFFTYATTFRGGFTVAVGDVDGDGADEIITGASPGGGPHVQVFRDDGTRIGSFFAYDQSLRNGVNVGAVDVDGDGVDEIIVGPPTNQAADIKLFRFATLTAPYAFRALGGFRGGVSISGYRSGDAPRVLLGAGSGGGPRVVAYDPTTGGVGEINTFPFDTSWRGGVAVAAVDRNGEGQTEFVASPGVPTLTLDQLIALGVVPSIGLSGTNSSWEERSVVTANGTFRASIVRIDLTNPHLKIKTLTATADDCKDNCPVHPLKYYVDVAAGFAGINGSYFCPIDYASCQTQDGSYFWMWFNSSTGTFVNAYQNQFTTGGGLVAFDAANQAYFYQVAKDWPGREAFESTYQTILRALLSNGPTLIFNGQLVVTSGQLDDKQRTVKSARSGIGFKGNSAYLVVATGATVLDLGQVMDALSLTYALNLDGGGSSALYYTGQYRIGPGRNIPNAVVFTES